MTQHNIKEADTQSVTPELWELRSNQPFSGSIPGPTDSCCRERGDSTDG